MLIPEVNNTDVIDLIRLKRCWKEERRKKETTLKAKASRRRDRYSLEEQVQNSVDRRRLSVKIEVKYF